MNPLIIIPTLNESCSIGKLITCINELHPECHILVVDGSSTDGTIGIVKDLSEKNAQIEIMVMEPGKGFGAALRSGFHYAVEHQFNPVITMDGDFSQSPEYLKDFFSYCIEYDLVIGSRYVNGVRVEGWKFRKLLMSKLANMYISYILVKPIWDFTSGFRCYNLKLLESISINKLSDQAYIIQIQLLYFAFRRKFRVKEIPFVYREREGSISKVDPQSKRRTFFWVLKYRAPITEILRHLTYLKKDYKRFVNEYDELINPPLLKFASDFTSKSKVTLSIGVMAYNEENMIGRCLEGLLNQKLCSAEIKEIIIVSSGSTDRTSDIVREYAKENPIIKIIEQPVRLGKANAINEFLKLAAGDIAILESADTTTEPDTIEELIKPLKNKEVGIVGAHPVPINKSDTLIGYCVNKLWALHHAMAMDTPKCGELIAFRNIINKISDYTAVDEAAIESVFRHHKYKLAYSAQAIVHNKGPETLREFVRQRRRIASGHRQLFVSTGHLVPTYSTKKIIRYVLDSQSWNPKYIFYTLILIGVEGFSRFAGLVDYFIRDKNPFIWGISKTTKRI